MKFKIPHKTIVVNITILLLILAEIFFILPPNLKKINEIQEDIQKQFAEVDRQLALGQTTKKVKEDLEKIKPFLEKISIIFLNRQDQLAFITTLETTASKHNIEATIVLPDIPTSSSKKEVFQIPLALTLKGSYVDIVEFLVEIQNLDFYVNIVDISMNAQAKDATISNINTNLRANTYWKNQ